MTFEYKLMTLVTNVLLQEKDKKFVSPFLYDHFNQICILDPCFDDNSVILLSRKFSISENF